MTDEGSKVYGRLQFRVERTAQQVAISWICCSVVLWVLFVIVDKNLLRYQEKLSPSLLQLEPWMLGGTNWIEDGGGLMIYADEKVKEGEMEVIEWVSLSLLSISELKSKLIILGLSILVFWSKTQTTILLVQNYKT